MTILLSKRIRPGSGSGKALNAFAGCDGFDLPITLQQTDTASADAIDTIGPELGIATPESGVGPDWDGVWEQQIAGIFEPPPPPLVVHGYTATHNGTPGTGTDGPWGVECPPPANVGIPRYFIMWETAPGECDGYICPAGNWTVPCQLSGTANVYWQACYVVRVNSSGVVQQTVGASLVDLPATATQSVVIAGAGALFSPGDRIVIICTFAAFMTVGSGGSGVTPTCPDGSDGAVNTFFSIGHGGLILTPMISNRAVYPAIRIRKGSGSGSGRIKEKWAFIRKCGPYRLAKRIRAGSGSGSGRRKELWAWADCCPPFSGSGSGSGPPPFMFGPGCGPGNPCGHPQTPGNLGPGCDLTGWPNTLYENFTGISVHNFPASFSVPLYWYNTASLPFLDGAAPVGGAYVGWYTDLNASWTFNPATGNYSLGCPPFLPPPPGTGGIVVIYPAIVFCLLSPCATPSGGGGSWHFRNLYNAAPGSADVQSGADLFSMSVETPPGIDLIYTSGGFAVTAPVVTLCPPIATGALTVTQ